MSQALRMLSHLLTLEPLDNYLFLGRCENLGLRQVFGGQVVAQAISAAQQTLPAERTIHSCHSYFLRPAESNKPIIYEIEVLRDGKSLSARRVKAIQNGQAIFYMTASFQGLESGYSHQSTMPDCPRPEELLSEQQLLSQLEPTEINQQFIKAFSGERPLDIRPVQPYNPIKGWVTDPHRQLWIKANGLITEQSDLHTTLLGYASDLNFIPVALQPHGKGFLEEGMQVATIDHSIWFHRPVNLNEWILYDIYSPSAQNNRGYVRGEFYNLQGELIASTAQEGIIRDNSEY